MKKILLTYVFALILGGGAFAQDCSDYHQYHCVYSDYTFFYSRQSKSELFQRGQTSSYNIVVYGGEDYYVAVCAHRKFGNLHFRILDANNPEVVIYDNSQNDYASSIVFSNENTRNLVVEVTVPLEGGSAKEKRCVGMLVQFKKQEE